MTYMSYDVLAMNTLLKKTMVYLEEEQFLLLKKVAYTSNRKMSEIIREALAQYFTNKKNPAHSFTFIGIAKGPKRGNASEQVEKTLREALRSSS